MKSFVIIFFIFIISPLAPQELEGWRSFSLPGLPHEEQYILGALLNSTDRALALTALRELARGVESGRISAQSQEYKEFLGEIISASRIRSLEPTTGLEKIFAEDPRSLFILVDLVFPLPEASYLDYLGSLLETKKSPILLQYVLEKIARSSKRLSDILVDTMRDELTSQGHGMKPIDQGFVYALLKVLVHDFEEYGALPDESLIEPLFLIRNRSGDTRLRTEIYTTLESIYLFSDF